ncbi:glycosyl transferase [Nocardioides currus]|uniref:Glycosyl transferase n=1 Tax=Nocardioides currus TaxID=2133958 RepID=A0A2R7Z0L3_9ACTN|nr:glycosyl transferase [Nocardioides currus]
MDRRTVAVVVTFNRLALLQRLVARLGEVEGLDEVLVVDNASTDGTGAWLAGTTTTGEVPVLARTLDHNKGGAGGFHDGLGWAIDRDADLVWLMDDDGLPEPGCLMTLLDHDFDFWGPLVVDEDHPADLVFPVRPPRTASALRTVEQARAKARGGVLADIVIPFNGVLVTRELVDRIGLPREEFFIWGDDVEYLWRAVEAGARVATITDAVVAHPSVGELGTPMAFGRTTYNHSPSDLKHYCMARNNLVNLRDYRGPLHAMAFVLKTIWFYTFTRPSLARLRLSASAMKDGLAGDYDGHERFLR